MLFTLRTVVRRPRVRALCLKPYKCTTTTLTARGIIPSHRSSEPNVLLLPRFPNFDWKFCARGLHSAYPLWAGTEASGRLRTGNSHPYKYHPSLFLIDHPHTNDSRPNPKETQIKSDATPSMSNMTPEDPDKNKVTTNQKKLSLWQKVKKEIVHYYHGFRLLGLDVKIASGICFRLLCGHSLTRRERKQLVRTVADIIRLVPFAVFIIVPFMEFLLPFYLKFFPFMLPSTFKDQSSEAEKIRQRLKAKLEMTRFLQETLHHTTGGTADNEKSPSFEQFQAFLQKVQESGQFVSDQEITRFSKLFEDQITLDSLEVNQLKMLCRLLSLPTIGPSNLLRFQLQMRVRQLKAEDRLLAKEGVDSIPAWELQSLCQDRGMRSAGLTEQRLRNQLAQWLDLHLEKNVPVTLLLFSRALHVSKASPAELPLQEAIARLPTSVSDEATARVLEGTELDARAKIELLRKEQASIKAARVQLKQELAQQKKMASAVDAKLSKDQKLVATEELVDQAPVLKGLPKEDLKETGKSPPQLEVQGEQPGLYDTKKPERAIGSVDKVLEKPSATTDKGELELKEALDKVLSTKSKFTKEEETEITVGDLAQIESAIAESSNALREEALEGLKEEVAETATKHSASLVSAERVVDKRTTKAAQRLASRVGRMIGEMDSMIDKLVEERQQLLKDIELRTVHVKHSTEPTEKTEMLEAIEADQARVVDINDLLLALRRLQKVPDDTRWQKILEVLDEDHDGKIEMQHVLSVIELLGAENVKLSSKEIKRVLEMIDNEQLAELAGTQGPSNEAKKGSVDAASVTGGTRSSQISQSSVAANASNPTTTTPFGMPRSSESTVSHNTPSTSPHPTDPKR